MKPLKKIGFLYFFFITLLLCLLSCNTHPVNSIDDVFEPISIDDPLEPKPINRARITIGKEDFKYLFNNCFEHGERYERSCTFSAFINGKNIKIKHCGIRIHGGYSRQLPKKSLRIYFRNDPLISEEIFKGFPTQFERSNEFSQLILSADLLDYSHIRNYLSMYFSNKAGCFTPRITFVWLDINGIEYGLYSVIERVNNDFCEELLNHDDFDLVKAANYNANLKSIDWNTGEPKEIRNGYEIKRGSIKPVEDLVAYIENGCFNLTDIKGMVSPGFLYSYFTSAYITDDNDAFYYNYYLLHDKRKKYFSIIRWDADITYDRPSGILNHIPLKEQFLKNGLYHKLGQTFWKDYIKQFIKKTLETDFQESAQLAIVDSLDACLRDYAIKDLKLWWERLETWFETETWDDYFSQKYNKNTCDELYNDNIGLIKEFITTRNEEVLAELKDW